MQHPKAWVSCALLLCTWASGATAKPQIAAARLQTRAEIEAQWRWTKQKGVGDNAPLVALRRSIDRTLAQGQTPQAVIDAYRQRLPKEGFSRNWAFGLAYAVYRASRQQSQDQRMEAVSRADGMLIDLGPPQPTEILRLRFLLNCQVYPNLHMKPLGERLVRRDPRDQDVKYHFVEFLNTFSPPERKRAIQYVQELVRAKPRSPDPYIATWSVYRLVWKFHGEQSSRRAAISALDNYLRVAPADHYFRSQALRSQARLKANVR